MTTNLQRNPSAEESVLYMGTISGATNSRTSGDAAHGDWAVTVTTPGVVANEGSCWRAGSGEPGVHLGYTGEDRTFIGSTSVSTSVPLILFLRVRYVDTTFTNTTNTAIPAGVGWARYATPPITVDPAKVVDYFDVWVRTANIHAGTFRLDAGQVEEGSVMTPFVIGTRRNTIFPILKVGSPHIGPLRAGKA